MISDALYCELWGEHMDGQKTKVNSYRPNPIDASSIQMPEGWSYGENRDDDAKTTSGLDPCDELRDSEKVYDKTTSMETVKLIVKLGYRIEKGGHTL